MSHPNTDADCYPDSDTDSNSHSYSNSYRYPSSNTEAPPNSGASPDPAVKETVMHDWRMVVPELRAFCCSKVADLGCLAPPQC